jgi:hypothetical protein
MCNGIRSGEDLHRRGKIAEVGADRFPIAGLDGKVDANHAVARFGAGCRHMSPQQAGRPGHNNLHASPSRKFICEQTRLAEASQACSSCRRKITQV